MIRTDITGMQIRAYQDSDWSRLWPILRTVFREGESYPVSPDITQQKAMAYWTEPGKQSYVAVNAAEEMLGSYYIKPNQPSLGAHVCNCGYLVAEQARGQGVASRLCEHSQQVAVEMGYRAMQYNLVVTTNEPAVRLWKKMGFQVVGVLPEAFNSKSRGYVDALVMYKQLVDDSLNT